MMGFAFPLFTTQMFDSLGYHWGNTLFGCIALLLIPVPFVRPYLNVSPTFVGWLTLMQVLYRFGPLIRSKSTFSQKAMEAQMHHR